MRNRVLINRMNKIQRIKQTNLFDFAFRISIIFFNRISIIFNQSFRISIILFYEFCFTIFFCFTNVIVFTILVFEFQLPIRVRIILSFHYVLLSRGVAAQNTTKSHSSSGNYSFVIREKQNYRK